LKILILSSKFSTLIYPKPDRNPQTFNSRKRETLLHSHPTELLWHARQFLFFYLKKKKKKKKKKLQVKNICIGGTLYGPKEIY
jgi:hypothetical protein